MVNSHASSLFFWTNFRLLREQGYQGLRGLLGLIWTPADSMKVEWVYLPRIHTSCLKYCGISLIADGCNLSCSSHSKEVWCYWVSKPKRSWQACSTGGLWNILVIFCMHLITALLLVWLSIILWHITFDALNNFLSWEAKHAEYLITARLIEHTFCLGQNYRLNVIHYYDHCLQNY